MPVVRSRVAPAPAPATKSTDEALELELSLQRKFEEDVARIFDESIYTDFELVCGRSKILTHKCILKARTKRFYQKLETVLNVNINQNTYDEIYSFISDAYTECNIKKQEKEILEFLDKTFGYLSQNSSAEKNIIKESATAFPSYAKADIDEAEVFLSPKSPECTTPYYDKEKRKSISSSPSIELTKEYYALVPIDNRLLEQELREQDVLLNAFQSIIKSQSEESSKDTSLQRNKPTSLSLRSSLSSKSSLHSSDCDPLLKKTDTNQACSEADTKSEQSPNTSKAAKAAFIKSTKDPVTKSVDVAFSPDSLIADEPSFVTDEPSSSSDYLSAAYNFSPCISTSGYNPQLNVGKHITKMDNVFTSSDSGLENTGLLESLNGQKDVTLTDISLTDSTLHDLITDDASHSSSPQQDNFQVQRTKYDNSSQATSLSGTSSDNYYEPPHRKQTYKTSKESTSFKSSKEEKQRQNEEIVILESSSLSSETGSWESVFPPKLGEKEACTAFLINERQVSNMADKSDQIHRNKPSNHYKEDLCPSLVQKSPFKSTSCFIDAASLVDDEEATITVHTDVNQERVHIRAGALPVPSQPVPCSTAKPDISPGDWSEGHDNDDSLEQLDQKDPDSLQKDLSPTIFDMTPITEDSLCANFENATHPEDETMSTEKFTAADNEPPNSTVRSHVLHASTASFAISTPHNSIMSLRSSTLKQDHSEDDSDSTIVTQDEPSNVRKQKNLDYSPIVSGGASIEDHLPQVNSYTSSPMARRKIENIPIVSGAYVPEKEEKKKSVPKTSKPSAVAAWVVDMSNSVRSDDSSHSSDSKKPNDRNFESLKHECSQDTNCKSRSSVDSNGSEKSSHKFYIDLSSLPDPLPPKNESTSKSVTEKKNIFSMYIDLGEKSSLKEMPARLSSSLSGKKNLDSSKSSSSSITDTNTKSIGNSKLANISETTNKSKESSTPKVVKSNNVTFETPKGMASFEEYEALCEIPDISITDIIGVWPVSEKSKTSSSDVKTKKDLQSVQEEIEIKGNQENIKPKSEQTNEVFKGSDVKTMDVFVRLSDLDKPKPHVDSMIAIHEHSVTDVRMTRSIPDYDQKHAGGRSIDVISSFHSENALSLNRLFPHLKNEFSRSMPGSLSRTRSPIITTASSLCELEEQPSDLSEVSSVQSSYCRSVVENSTTEESQTSSLIGHCQSKLGQDLLRMFLEEIAPDVIVEVSGRRFKAHKCILSSRCQYFAGILSGGWVESAGNVIILPPFSFNVVHFALCHIYSGVSTIPDSISIVELATIADMLGLEGLKEAIMFTLKVKYCHHFHKPCLVCTAGVLECFTLSSVYGLDDLYLKCLKWISKYFHIVWPTKAFATLPKELLDKCYQQHIVNMTVDNLPDTVCGCGMIVGILQSTRWAETVERMCRRLLNAGARFAAPRLLGVLRAVAALPVEEVPPLGLQALDDCLTVAIEWAPPDEACRAYAFLSHVVKEIRSRHSSKPDLVSNGDVVSNNLLWFHANDWRLRCESSIVRSAPRAIDTQAFQDLPQDLRKRLRELGCIIYGTRTMSTSNQERKQKVTPPRSKPHTSTRSLDMEHVRALFVPYAAAPNARQGSAARPQRPPPKPLPIRSTRAQEQRAKFNLLNTNQSQDRGKRAPRPDRFENTKPRYLEPRPTQDKKRLTVKMVSSSESSRNSSPVQPRAARASRICAQHDSASAAMSQDSLASRPRTAEPSTDSLTESQTSNKYATYTKAKHPKGSVESIKSCTRPALTVATAAKMKTKIPILLNHHPKRVANGKGPANGPAAPPSQGGPCDRKVSGSLMMATKSSQAKMVPKINKDEKPAGKTVTKPKGKAKNVSKVKQAEIAPPVDIPAMSRSGTFLKDEPMFGGNTTDIDIAP